ncbi:MAG: citrate synthase/methylcitrate synthase [Devosia sp.]|nr:citrate synthase/methylcitrate synthase [Devosia sp.]
MSTGLADVVAAETVLSDVDGLAGRLVIRGLPLEALAGLRYEAVLHLLWQGFFDDLPEIEEFGARLGEARAAAFADWQVLAGLSPFDAVRAALARQPDDTDLASALRLAAAPAVFLPAALRAERGLPAIAPDPALAHAADILRMLTGRPAAGEQVDALDAYLVTVADHGLNASTFAARVVASTQAGLMSAVLAAMGALKGPLHGGAPGPVLDMLDAIGTADNAAPWIGASLARGERLMGFGHRIYRVRDPRAEALQRALRLLRSSGNASITRMDLAMQVETAALEALRQHRPERPLATNVEFYTALLLEALGFPREAFTAVFAIGRTGGWIAHAREQALTGKLIRPRSLYVGPQPRQAA